MARIGRKLALVAAGCGLLALAACTSAATPAPAPAPAKHQGPRPNIVFVLTDDLSTDLLAYMPHVQAMMRSGTSFQNYFVVDSLCCPSRSSIFTGQYPHTDGVFTNEGYDGGYATFVRHGDDRHTFAVALHTAGYRTGFMGKYLNGYLPKDPRPPGWDDFVSTDDGYSGFNYTLNDDGHLHRYGHAASDYFTDVLGERADAFLDDAAQHTAPFVLELATFAPHLPSVPAPRDQGSFPDIAAPRTPAFDVTPEHAPNWLAGRPPLTAANRETIDEQYRRRVESVQAVDRLIGNVEARLQSEGRLRNTFFVFSSDNGYHMGQYRLMPGKQTAFDTDIRLPLVVDGPGVPAGRQVTAFTSSIDLAPTFAAIAGTRPPRDPDGASMLALWLGHPAPPGWARAVLIEHHRPGDQPGDPDHQTKGPGAPPSYEALRTVDALYVEYRDGEREYHDLARDPYELDNSIATAPPGRIAALHAALHRLETCAGAAACQSAAQVS